MTSFRPAWSRPAITASVLLLGTLGSELLAQPVITLPYVNAPLYTRPNGSNFYWTYPTYENSVFGINDPRVVTSVAYYNVGPPTNYALTRGKVQYAASTAGPWTDFPSPTTTSYVTTAGRVFRFVDTLGDNTTQNAVGMGWNVVGHGSPITSGSNVFPDLPPTDVYPRATDYWGTPAFLDEISLLDVTDTGARFNYGGQFSIDSQSVPNLFAISGNKLVKGSGTLPAVGGTATVTLRYNDLFQLDNSGNPVSGQGATRTVTFTRRGNPATLTSELQVNTHTVGNQNSSSIAGLSDGSYVVVWRSDAQGEAVGMGGIYAQKFTSAGVKSGGEFSISDSGNGINEVTPTVSALNNGRFVVVYTKVNADNDIRFRIVEANGTVGAETAVPSSDTGAQGAPASTSLVGGGFAVTWVAPGTANDIYSRRFTDAGAPVSGSEGIVNTLVAGGQATPFISGLSNGDYVVVWRESTEGNGDIRFRVMGPTGQMAADAAATPDAGSQTNGRVAGLTGGGFVVLYAESGRTEGVVTDGSNGSTENNVYGQRFNSAGVAQGGEFLVHGSARGNQSTPAVMGLSGGGFVASWVGNTDPDETSGVYARRFDASGAATEHDFQLSQRRVGDQTQPALARLADNGLAASWTDETLDGDNNAVASRMLSGAAPLPNLTINDVAQNEGNSGTSTFSFTVSLSSAAPAGGVTFNYATANNTATAGSDYVAASGTGTIAAGNTSTTVTVTVNGDTTIEANETFFVNLTNITNATGTDTQGVGTINNDDADTIPPDTTITANPTNPTNDNTPTFNFTGTDNWTATGSLTYEARFGTNPFTTVTSPFTSGALADGSHTFQVRAKDAADNVDPTPASYTFVIDTTPPTAPVAMTPANGSTITTTTPNYTGTAEPSSTVTVTVDGSSIGTANADVSGNWTKAQPSALAQGSHTVRATATDAVGNTSGNSNTNTFTVDTTPPAAPVTITPANGSQTVDTTPDISGTAENNSTVTVFIDGSSVGTTGANASGNWTLTAPTALSLGSHTARARATDAAGNTSVDSNTNTFSVYSPVTVSGTLTASGSFVPNGTVTYTATLTNNSSAPSLNSTGNEFTLALPSQLTLVSATSTSGSASTSGSTVNWNGGIAASGSVTITITATVKADATGTVSAQGSISYDTDSNGSNDATAVTDDPTVTGANNATVFEIMPDKVSLAHAITTTSVGGNDGFATIGENVTLGITVTVPDGATSDLVIQGTLPDGLGYIAGSSSLNTSGFNGTVSTVNVARNGGQISFSISSINATADGNGANNKFTIGLQTKVQDVVTNVGVTPSQTVLTTGFTHNNGGLDPDFTAPLANASVTVVEPRVVTSAAINETSANVGGTVTFGVSLQNTGTSAAHGARATMVLPATHFNLASVANVGSSGGFTFTLDPVSGVLSFSSDDPLAASVSGTVLFNINLAANAPAGPYTLPALSADASTLAGTVTGERRYTITGSTDSFAIVGPPAVTAPVLGTTTVNEGAIVFHTVSGSFTDNNGTFTGVIDWGDGSTNPLTINNAAKTYSYSGNHTYAQSGVYSVTAAVTNAQSYTGGSAAATVTVNNVAPVVAAPNAPSPEAAVAGVSTSFSISGLFTDPASSLDAPYTAVVNWGDGTTSAPASIIGSGNPYGYSVIENHTYATTGAKTVTVTVTDGDGDSTTSDPITVNVVGGADYAVTTSGGQLTITDNSGNGDTLTVSAPSAGQIRFAAPNRYFSVNGGPLITGSSGNLSLTGISQVTINPAGGDDVVTFNAMANLPSITINDGAGSDQVWVNSILSFASGSSLQANADRIAVGDGASITTSGLGVVRLAADTLGIFPTSTITSAQQVELQPLTADREILLGIELPDRLCLTDAELDAITTPKLTVGSATAGAISVEAAISPANASVLVLGTGGAITSVAGNAITSPFLILDAGNGIGTPFQPLLTQVPKISAVTATGRISISNAGNLQVGDAAAPGLRVNGGNAGIVLQAAGSITVNKQIKSPGAITLTATGATSDITVGAGSYSIETTGLPQLSGITLVAGRDLFLGTASDYGDVVSAGALALNVTNDVVIDNITALLSKGSLSAIAGGDFTVSKTYGLESAIEVMESGDLSITAAGVITLDSGAGRTVVANGGAITLTADLLMIPTTGFTNVVDTTGVVTIKPYTAARPVSVGGVSANELSLTDALLDKVTAGGLVLGDSNAGALTVLSTITRTSATNATLASGGDVILAGTIETAGGNLTLIPGTAPAKVKSAFTGTDAPLGGGKLAINGRLELAINGATAGTGYEQLIVNGTVDVSATSLVLQLGAYVPSTGDTLTLVDNDGTDPVTGSFVGLPEGGTLTFNGILMRITYAGGDGNDIVLGLANREPTNISLTSATLPENAGANAEVGTLSSTDPDTGDTFTYTLVTGTGDADNIDFNILGNKLRLTASANYEAKSSYSVRIRTTDQGSLSYEKEFTILITDVAENPTITAIDDIMIDEDTATGALDFSIADQDAGSTLTVTATSDNQALVPDASIILSGTGANRSVYVAPVANAFGVAEITLVVSDGALTGSTSYTVTVNSVNDEPVVVGGIPDVTLVASDRTASLNLETYFSDIETASSAMTYTVTPAAGAPFHNLTRTGNTLNIAATAPGEVVITVTAQDADTATVSDSFTLRVKHVPEIAGTGIPDTLLSPASTGLDIILGNYFLDQDSDALTYTIASNNHPELVSGEIDGDTLTLHPQGAGVATFTIRATDSDGNFIEHSFDVTVNQPVPDPVPTVTSPPKLNRQTGLWEITLTATNNNVFNVPGFRFRVTSEMPSHIRLYNSTAPIGSGEPYLDVLTLLPPGQAVTVVLEFHSTTRNFTGFNPTIIAEPLPEDISNVGDGQGMEISRFVNLTDGSKLIEFSSIAGRWYEIQYSSDLITWKRSLVPVQAGANFTQWIDRGAPYTESHPSTVPQRFYRVSEIVPD